MSVRTAGRRFHVIGFYYSAHPGIKYCSGGDSETAPRWWATFKDKSMPRNYYRIGEPGNRYWYPGGLAGQQKENLRCGNAPRREGKTFGYISPLLEIYKEISIKLIESGELNWDDLDYVPLKWRGGLWNFNSEFRRKLCPQPALRCANQANTEEERYQQAIRPVLQHFEIQKEKALWGSVMTRRR
jgi:hypothetical protein